MTIRCQKLKHLETNCSSNDEGNNEQYSVRVGEAESESHQRKGGKMLKMRPRDRRTVRDRGQGCKDNEGQCEPTHSNGYLLSHVTLVSYK